MYILNPRHFRANIKSKKSQVFQFYWKIHDILDPFSNINCFSKCKWNQDLTNFVMLRDEQSKPCYFINRLIMKCYIGCYDAEMHLNFHVAKMCNFIAISGIETRCLRHLVLMPDITIIYIERERESNNLSNLYLNMKTFIHELDMWNSIVFTYETFIFLAFKWAINNWILMYRISYPAYLILPKLRLLYSCPSDCLKTTIVLFRIYNDRFTIFLFRIYNDVRVSKLITAGLSNKATSIVFKDS